MEVRSNEFAAMLSATVLRLATCYKRDFVLYNTEDTQVRHVARNPR